MTRGSSGGSSPAEGHAEIAELVELPAPSSFMSSRWSRDNLITSHPARLYSGNVIEPIGLESLEELIQLFAKEHGQLRTGAVRMGVFTWDIACANDDGPFVLQVPRVLDEPGQRGRAKSDVPRLNVENLRYFAARGLTRFLVEAKGFATLGVVPAATFASLPDHHPLKFGRGSLQVELAEDRLAWLIGLGTGRTADLLAEMVAALVYHYEADLDGGTTIADVAINDGDFFVKRRPDGSFDLRLTAARKRESGVGKDLFLLYLAQLMAYEDFSIGAELTGLPLLVSNPSIAFEGVVRGLTYRERDLGQAEGAGRATAFDWIRSFGRSREGHSYRAFADRFLEGRLPLSFGDDVREHWWRLGPLETKLGVLELRARAAPAAEDVASARTLRTFVDRLSREIGRLPEESPETVRINDLDRDALLALLEAAQAPAESRASTAEELFSRWPYRNLDHLLARVPGARGLRRLKRRLSFGSIVPDSEQGTLKSLGPAPKEGARRVLANPEVFGALSLQPAVHETAARAFPTFEAYMDTALHDPKWGYYARNVLIGAQGHFNTHPESLSPRYGAWIADWAFRSYRDMLARGELAETDPFPIIEFGAGNGRLARDVLDAIAKNANDLEPAEAELFRTFAARARYRIYEMSESLRQKQRALLGDDAVVTEGDARRPLTSLERDFPGGLRGFVVTNEVPDAFGFHKVILTRDGHAFAALVVPRLEPAVREALGTELARRVVDTDATLRETFELRSNAGDFYLDRATFGHVMETLAELPAAQREELWNGLWFEEAYLPASLVPELTEHFRANAAQYATALAAEDSGVVLYVNVHANGFMHELGSALAAGFIVTIDYGDTTWSLVQAARRGDFPFRVYGDWQEYRPRTNDPYSAPGTQDMTADVNFTDLARAGLEVGLKLVHFGPERDLCREALPELLRAANGDDVVAKFLGNPIFKILVLGKRETDAFAAPLLTPLPLFCKEQDVPKSRRERIAALERTLASLGD